MLETVYFRLARTKRRTPEVGHEASFSREGQTGGKATPSPRGKDWRNFMGRVLSAP